MTAEAPAGERVVIACPTERACSGSHNAVTASATAIPVTSINREGTNWPNPVMTTAGAASESAANTCSSDSDLGFVGAEEPVAYSPGSIVRVAKKRPQIAGEGSAGRIICRHHPPLREQLGPCEARRAILQQAPNRETNLG